MSPCREKLLGIAHVENWRGKTQRQILCITGGSGSVHARITRPFCIVIYKLEYPHTPKLVSLSSNWSSFPGGRHYHRPKQLNMYSKDRQKYKKSKVLQEVLKAFSSLSASKEVVERDSDQRSGETSLLFLVAPRQVTLTFLQRT